MCQSECLIKKSSKNELWDTKKCNNTHHRTGLSSLNLAEPTTKTWKSRLHHESDGRAPAPCPPSAPAAVDGQLPTWGSARSHPSPWGRAVYGTQVGIWLTSVWSLGSGGGVASLPAPLCSLKTSAGGPGKPNLGVAEPSRQWWGRTWFLRSPVACTDWLSTLFWPVHGNLTVSTSGPC